MIASFVITLREGIEAALIIGIILSYLTLVGARHLSKVVYYGIALGILASLAVAGLLGFLAIEFEGELEEAFEGVMMLLAAGILTYTILWMHANSKAYSDTLRKHVESAVNEKHVFGLAALAFVTIFREGVETVIFLGSASYASSGLDVLIGGLLGLAVAAMLAILLVKYSVRINLRTFFKVTGALMILFAAGLVAHGIGELQEVGMVPAIAEHVWDTSALLSDEGDVGQLVGALFGYSASPSAAQVIGYFGYLISVTAWIFRQPIAAFLRNAYASIRPA